MFTRWPKASVFYSRSRGPGFEPWQRSLGCILGQSTLRSQCLSAPRKVNGYPLFVKIIRPADKILGGVGGGGGGGGGDGR